MVLVFLCAPPRLKASFQKRIPSSVRVRTYGRKLLLWSWMCKWEHFQACEINRSNPDGLDPNQVSYRRALSQRISNYEVELGIWIRPLFASPTSRRMFFPLLTWWAWNTWQLLYEMNQHAGQGGKALKTWVSWQDPSGRILHLSPAQGKQKRESKMKAKPPICPEK